MQVKLVVVGGHDKAQEIRLKLPTIIGRGKGCTLRLPHPLVSRQHCEIFEMEGRLVVRDLGSLNGTFVNNQRITEAELPHGDLLTIGSVTFRAVYAADTTTSPIDKTKTVMMRPGDATISDLPATKSPAQTDESPDDAEPQIDFSEHVTIPTESINDTGVPDFTASEDDNEKIGPPSGSDAPSKADNASTNDDEDDLEDFLRSLGK